MSDYLPAAWSILKHGLMLGIASFAIFQLGLVGWLIWSVLRSRRGEVSSPPP